MTLKEPAFTLSFERYDENLDIVSRQWYRCDRVGHATPHLPSRVDSDGYRAWPTMTSTSVHGQNTKPGITWGPPF